MSSSENSLAYSRAALAPSWRRTLHGYLSLARVSNSPTVASNVLAGAALGGALRPNGTIALLAVALVLFYTAGMFLNDVCDYAVDVRERAERALPQGVVSRSAAGAVVVALFAAGSLLLWAVGRPSFLGGLVLMAIIVVYDLWHKTNPLSPLVMASARLMVYVISFLAFAVQVSAALLISGGLLVLYVVGLTYIAKKETSPSFTNYWPAGLLFLPVTYFGYLGLAAAPPIWLVLVPFLGWIAYSISFIYRSTGRSIGGATGQLIAGMALLDALVLAMAGSLAGVLLALVAFGTTLFFQRYVRGT